MAEIASAFITIAPSMRGFGGALNAQAGGSIRSSGKSLGAAFGKAFLLGGSVLAAAGVGNLLSGSIDEAREAQKVGAQTNAVLKSTGGVANVSAGQVGRLASALSAKIGVDDEAIQAGENLLLTFTNVRNEAGKGNDIFNQATRTVQDMAAAFGGDATSNSKILGKALNDPVKGVSALTRVGVSFTDAQKEQIKTLVASGDTLGAQKIILGELAKETKGSAAAQVTAGDKAKVAFGNLKETVGTLLLPVIDKLATIFTDRVAPAITTFIGQLQSGEGAGGRVAAIFQTVSSILGTVFGFINSNKTVLAVFVGTIYAIVGATAAWNAVLAINPISIVVIAIAALAAGLVYAYKKSDTFRAVVDKAFAVVKTAASAVANFVSRYFPKAFSVLVTVVKTYITVYKTIAVAAFKVVKAIVDAVATFVVNSAQKYVTFQRKVGEVVGKVAKFFKELPGKIKGFLTSLPGELKRIGGDIIQGLVNGIKGAAHYVTDAVNKIISAIPKKIRSLMHIGSPSKVTAELGGYIGEGLAVGLRQSEDVVSKQAERLGKKVKEKLDKLRDNLASVRSDFAGLVDPIAGNFTQGLFDFDNAGAFTANLTTVKGTLTTLLGNFKTLIAEGLNPGFLYQLFQSGGPGLINSLASLPKADALAANSLFQDVTSLSNQLGTAVAGATDKGAALENQTVRLEKKLDKLINATKSNAREVGIEINGAASRGRRRAA